MNYWRFVLKYFFKVICIILLIIAILFLTYIVEESIRLKTKPYALPLIITGKTEDYLLELKPGEEIEVEYLSFGYNVKIKYYISDFSSADNKNILISGKDFMLFNKFRLWAWIT